MANGAANSQPDATWPEVQSGPLIVGGSLIGIGLALVAAGVAVAGAHLVSATRQWSATGRAAQPVRAAEVGTGQDRGRVRGRHLARAPQRQGAADPALRV